MNPFHKYINRFSVLCLLILILGCSKSESEDDSTFFSPPNWIQGEWTVNSSGSSSSVGLTGFEFTQDDFITIRSGYYSSQNDFLNHSLAKSVYATEEISSNVYTIVMNYILATDIYEFSQISSTEMSCEIRYISHYSSSERVENYTLSRK